jgi:glycosyltransferase involved in cell wall biosynthesis
LSDKIDFHILTADRDLGDDKPFKNIINNEWIKVGNAKVFYISPQKLTCKKMAEIINSIDYKFLYLNSFFSYKFSILAILLNKIKRIPQKPIILAPRGELLPRALELKSKKKKLFIKIVKTFNLYKDIIWHATAETEKVDIKSVFGNKINIRLAGNLIANYEKLKYDKKITKNKGKLKVVFASRIHPKKNLKKAIELLKNINGKIEFNIYGPLEDKKYWLECEKVIESLGEDIKVEYKGLIYHNDMIGVFKKHHVFLFPTFSENFGHVIPEALIGGCPVIISTQTPWRDLEQKQIGWDIDLNDKNRFIHVLQYCVNMTQEQYNVLSRAAFWYAKKLSNKEEGNRYLYELFSDI